MTNGTVFYSWQSDTNQKYNRNFIEDCLKRAIKNINKQVEISYVLDRDTKNKEGTPDIAKTIFEKIDNCQLFIADITLINYFSDIQRKTPNPNVLVELGYAASKIGWENIICVFNSSFGEVNKLPFDIKSRRVLQYSLNGQSNKKDTKNQLVRIFENIINKIDINQIQKQYKIKKVFKDEPDYVMKIAIEQSEYWEFELLGKLLDIRFFKLDQELDNIAKGFVFGQKQIMSSEDFLNWIEESSVTISSIYKNIKTVINKEFPIAIGDPGQPGDAIKIKKISDILYLILKDLVDIEINLNMIIPTKYVERLKSLMDGWAKELIDQIRILPKELEKIYKGHYKDENEINIKIKLEPFQSIEEMLNLIQKLKNNLKSE